MSENNRYLAVPPGSERSAYRSAEGLVRTAWSEISNRNAQYGWHVPVCPLTGMQTTRYQAVPSIGAVSALLPPEIGR
ncbi:hypothetical protein B296_00017816 [Ensete ventricosum]|uniref:Uncharacterized protein n=1 Tax=Ensete ventricosum TaxID=4639 RepID=A0A427A7E9_ENSVE|nr:hypothetical protein B296_00017816 [Ensete ventricosum]